MKLLLNRNIVIMFSHSNYFYNIAGGTEKFIKQLQDKYNEDNISTISFFPYRRLKNCMVMYFDKTYAGMVQLENIPDIIKHLSAKYELNILTTVIQHVMGYDLSLLAKTLTKVETNIILAIHDFYFVCNSYSLMKNNVEFCGFDAPDNKKCGDCSYYEKEKEFIMERDYFFSALEKQISKVVFPSEFCKQKWTKLFPIFQDRSVVRSHLKWNGNYVQREENEILKIGFIGRKFDYKGYPVWMDLVGRFPEFEYYYFGKDIEESDVVTEILTTTANKDESVVNKLRNIGIDIVLLWSTTPETYSYTYYEASAADAMIITNHKAGNIACQVVANGNGVVFKDEKELYNFFKSERLREICHSKKHIFSPMTLDINDDVSLYYNFDTSVLKNTEKVKIKYKSKISIYSILYFFKYTR